MFLIRGDYSLVSAQTEKQFKYSIQNMTNKQKEKQTNHK